MSQSRSLIVDLLRHGEPEGGDILRGRINPVLTEFGWQQMRAAASLDASFSATANTPHWDTVISSPLFRCREFAERAASAVHTICHVEEQWQEIDYGDWDGMPLNQWRREAANQFRAFRQDMTALAPPNGEDFMSFKARILAAWQAICVRQESSHVLVVTHGGVMRVVLPSVLGMPLNRSFPLHIPFACLSRIKLTWADDKVSASLIFHNGAAYREAN